MLLPAPPPAILRKPPLLLLPAAAVAPAETPLPTEPAATDRPPAEPYAWPDLSVGDPGAPDPLRGMAWPELRTLIYDPDPATPTPSPPISPTR